MSKVIYSKYSNERDRRFCIRTDIREKDGLRFVTKCPLYPEGDRHIQNLYGWYERLKKIYEKEGLVPNRCQKSDEGVRLEYVEGKTLEELLDNLLEKGEINRAAELLEKFLRQVEAICQGVVFERTEEFCTVFGEPDWEEEFVCAPVTNIDMLCSNLVLTEVPCVLDYEWTFDFPVPGKFVLYRIIHYYVDTHSVRKTLAETDFYKKMGISREQKEAFKKMETHFQDYITGNHVPMREMFSSITPGTGALELVGMGGLQIFFSDGTGYSEENSRIFPFEEGKISCSVEIPEGCIRIRIDPGNVPCAVKVSTLEINGEPVDLRKTVIEKGSICGNWIYIAKEDPSIAEIPVSDGAKVLEVSMEVHGASVALLENMKTQVKENISLREKVARLERQIGDMKNTKVWKLYQSYRNKVERKK